MKPTHLVEKRETSSDNINSFTIRNRQDLAAFDYLCRELEVRRWIERILGESVSLPSDKTQFSDIWIMLKDGEILRQLTNKIEPGSVPQRTKRDSHKLNIYIMDIVSKFLGACRRFGLKDIDLFEPSDLIEGKNMLRVIHCLRMLANRLYSEKKVSIGLEIIRGGEVKFPRQDLQRAFGRLKHSGSIVSPLPQRRSSLPVEWKRLNPISDLNQKATQSSPRPLDNEGLKEEVKEIPIHPVTPETNSLASSRESVDDWDTDPDFVNDLRFSTAMNTNSPDILRLSSSELSDLRDPIRASSWNLKQANLNINKDVVLGEGTFSVCYKGSLWGKLVAVKILKQQSLTRQLLEEFKQEVDVLSMLRHPNIVLFMGACLESECLAIITEFCAKGSLQNLLSKQSLEWPQKLKLAHDAALGMFYLHNMEIIHWDLKTGNILVDAALNAKVADFGLSTLKKDANKAKGNGTPQYMAPERFREDEQFTEKADVYSFGIILWELISEEDPYPNEDIFAMEAAFQRGERLEIPEGTPDWLQTLTESCWKENPDERPSMGVIAELLEEKAEKSL